MNPERYEQRILRVQLYIQENLDGDLSLESLAEVAQTSPYHFHRVFKGQTGETLAEYVRRVRLEQSSILVKHTDRAIVDIAFTAGYGTHEAYTRAFVRRFGISPSQFREGVIPKMNYQKGNKTMSTTTYDVRIVDLEPLNVAGLRHVGPYQNAGPTFQRLCQWAGMNGLFNAEAKLLGICHDDPNVTDESKIRFDCCITVGESFQADGDILKQTLEGGRYAVLRHTGPYTELAPTYDWFFSVWLSGSGEQLRDLPPFEIYVTDPERTPPEELQTDIYLPLE